MASNAKLYVVVRNDLAPGYQLAQSCHAAFQFSLEHPDLTRLWNEVSNYICCLSVDDEDALEQLAAKAEQRGIPTSRFFEPDLGDELTAIALAPFESTRALCKGLPLALKSAEIKRRPWWRRKL